MLNGSSFPLFNVYMWMLHASTSTSHSSNSVVDYFTLVANSSPKGSQSGHGGQQQDRVDWGRQNISNTLIVDGSGTSRIHANYFIDFTQ